MLKGKNKKVKLSFWVASDGVLGVLVLVDINFPLRLKALKGDLHDFIGWLNAIMS